MNEVKISITLKEAKEIFLCLCDAAARMNYAGVMQIYERARLLSKWLVDEEACNDEACRKAWQMFDYMMTGKLDGSAVE